MYSRSRFVLAMTRVHSRLQALADSGRGTQVVLTWGLLQGCIIPGLADLFFLPLALARPERAYRLALVAALGTITGSILLYFVGSQALGWLEGPLARMVGMSATSFDATKERLMAYGAWAIFASTMSPLSTKLTSIVSGAVGVPFMPFTIALLCGRLLRTVVLAWCVRNGGAEFVTRLIARAPNCGTSHG